LEIRVAPHSAVLGDDQQPLIFGPPQRFDSALVPLYLPYQLPGATVDVD
jgi:hypothetical protein